MPTDRAMQAAWAWFGAESLDLPRGLTAAERLAVLIDREAGIPSLEMDRDLHWERGDKLHDEVEQLREALEQIHGLAQEYYDANSDIEFGDWIRFGGKVANIARAALEVGRGK